MDWLVNDASFGLFTFRELTRFIAGVLDVPLTAATSLFATGLLSGSGSAAVQIAAAASLDRGARIAARCSAGMRGGTRLALLAGGAFLYLAAFGQWAERDGDARLDRHRRAVRRRRRHAARHRRLPLAALPHGCCVPILDGMQTIPVFAYLLPILFLFGFGPVAALVATIIYAMPPMVRVTMLALDSVPPEIVEFGRMAGCTQRQLICRVMMPVARRAADGRRQPGDHALAQHGDHRLDDRRRRPRLRRADLAAPPRYRRAGWRPGVAIVVLAVALDRISQAYALRAAASRRRGAAVVRTLRAAARWRSRAALLLWLLGLAVPALAPIPRRCRSRPRPTGTRWSQWLNVNFFDTFEAIKTAVLLNVLVPVKRFMLAQPWPWVTAVVAVARLARSAGWRRAVIAVLLRALHRLHRQLGAGDGDGLSGRRLGASSRR